MLVIEKRNIDVTLVRVVSSNYWSEKCERETVESVEAGYWVCFSANCIGHTRARMFEAEGECFLIKRYGEANLQAAQNEDWGTVYYRLR